MADLLAATWPTAASLALLVGLVAGVIGYARRPKAMPARREIVPTLIPADSTDFLPSTVAAPLPRREPRREPRRFEDSE